MDPTVYAYPGGLIIKSPDSYESATIVSAVIVSILDIFVLLSPIIFPYDFISPNTVILFMLVIFVSISPTISPYALISPVADRIPLMVYYQ